jgi:hypothetical protein
MMPRDICGPFQASAGQEVRISGKVPAVGGQGVGSQTALHSDVLEVVGNSAINAVGGAGGGLGHS